MKTELESKDVSAIQSYDGRPPPAQPQEPRTAPKKEPWAPEATAQVYLGFWAGWASGNGNMPNPIAQLKALSGWTAVGTQHVSECAKIGAYVAATKGYGQVRDELLKAIGLERGTPDLRKIARFERSLQKRIDAEPLTAKDFLHVLDTEEPYMSSSEQEQWLILRGLRAAEVRGKPEIVLRLLARLEKVQQGTARKPMSRRKARKLRNARA